MITLMHIGCYMTVTSLFIYLTTTFNFPLHDGWLRAFDSMVGYSPSALVAWTRSHPILDYWSTWIYLFITTESMFAIFAIAFSNHRRCLEKFVFQFMLGAFACGIIACVLPGNSPLHNHGITPTDWQQPFLDHFRALRTGEPFKFSWRQTEGLVTFPSFHTAWAVFLIVAWSAHTRWLFIPTTILNVLIIISTLTTGEHYLLDIAGGIALALFCIYTSHRVNAFAYTTEGDPRVVEWLSLPARQPAKRSALQQNG